MALGVKFRAIFLCKINRSSTIGVYKNGKTSYVYEVALHLF